LKIGLPGCAPERWVDLATIEGRAIKAHASEQTGLAHGEMLFRENERRPDEIRIDLINDRSITSYMPFMTDRKKSELTREHILTMGRGLVLRRGFGGVGLKELLDQSAVPKGSFYYYFASKEAFGCALLEDYCADYLGRLDALFAQAGSGRERLMCYWTAWLDEGRAEGLADRCLVVKLAAEIPDLSEDMRVILQDGVERLIDRIVQVIADGCADGSILTPRDPQAVARALYGLWLGAAILSKLGKDQAPMRDALLATERLLSDPTAD